MFEPEKEIESVNKRVDRLVEYTSFHADLLMGLRETLDNLEKRVDDLACAYLDYELTWRKTLLDAMKTTAKSTLTIHDIKERGTRKSNNRQVAREMELLKSEIQYLRDEVTETKVTKPLKTSGKL